MIVVLKIMYSYAPQAFAAMGDPEGLNPSLLHAWRDLRRPQEGALDELVQSVWNKPLEQLETTALSFSAIVNSEIMNSTLWPMALCNPFRVPCWRHTGTLQWYGVSEQPVPQEVAVFTQSMYPAPKSNALCIVAAPDMDLQAQVSRIFNVFLLRGANIEAEAAIWSAPCQFIHVHFDVQGVTENEVLNFQSSRTFELEIWDFVECKDGDRLTPVDAMRYNLVALIRHRTDATCADSIRVYTPNGECKTH